jgi:malonyl-CoA/methylmalonyl-CoA synthetase
VALVVGRKGERPDAEAILAALRNQLANFKIPKRCFVVDELPRNTMGKVQKAALREQYKALFAAGGTGGAGKS